MYILNLRQKLKQTVKLFLLASIAYTWPYSASWADNKQEQELKEQKENLRELLDRISDVQAERKEQRATLNKLEKQMSCNMTLIEDYDNCESQFKNNLELHVKCKHEAKEKAAKCLGSINE